LSPLFTAISAELNGGLAQCRDRPLINAASGRLLALYARLCHCNVYKQIR
jgi:hypothetical protein